MTYWRLALAGLSHYRRTHAAVAAGVAAAVAVLAGALLVGSSVRESLAGLTTARLGRTALVIGAERPFTVSLADRLMAQPALAGQIAGATPVFAARGFAEREAADVRASGVDVYGIDDRFFAFHGVTTAAPASGEVLLSPDLAAELGASPGDVVLVRVARPTDVPVDSLHGRKDDTGRSIRLRVREVLAAATMGEFSLAPAQGPVRAAFVALARLQRDLGQAGRATTLLLSAVPDRAPTSELVTCAPRCRRLTSG
jgi:putative ABC transport system permease protein